MLSIRLAWHIGTSVCRMLFKNSQASTSSLACAVQALQDNLLACQGNQEGSQYHSLGNIAPHVQRIDLVLKASLSGLKSLDFRCKLCPNLTIFHCSYPLGLHQAYQERGRNPGLSAQMPVKIQQETFNQVTPAALFPTTIWLRGQSNSVQSSKKYVMRYSVRFGAF